LKLNSYGCGQLKIVVVLVFNVVDHWWSLIELVCNKSRKTRTKGNNSKYTEDGVMVIVHCTSSHCAWRLYEVVLNSNY
jgi:hypothetical protein